MIYHVAIRTRANGDKARSITQTVRPVPSPLVRETPDGVPPSLPKTPISFDWSTKSSKP